VTGPTGPTPDAATPPPSAEPPTRVWDESPAEAARYDARHWDDLYDRDED
jgi:hypothetical protein